MRTRVPELRKKYGLTQQQLADITEVSRQTIIAIEQGKFNPSVMLAYKISKVFSLSIEDIFIFEEVK